MRSLSWWIFVPAACCTATLAAYPAPEAGGAPIMAWLDGVGLWFAVSLTVTVLTGWKIRVDGGSPAPEADEENPLGSPAEWLRDVAHALDTLQDPDQAGWREEIEEALDTHVSQIIDAREQLIATRGLLWYARFSDELARVERNLSRAWSACTDGSTEEASRALARGRTALDRCIEILEETDQGAAPPRAAQDGSASRLH